MRETLLFNLAAGSRTRVEMLEGKEYLVVPMVMAVEGVLDGSQGPLFYPGEEFAKTPVVWNHKPIVIYHPSANGQNVSACDPIVMEARKVGLILNTRWDTAVSKLRSEAWLEKSRLEKIDKRVLEAIEAGIPVEVSTGLFTDNEKADGEFKGKKYNAIARNYRPDHLAILPDVKGACSIDDGAGLLANQGKGYNRKECSRLARKGLALRDGSFPIVTPDDLRVAVLTINHAQHPAEAKAHVEKRARALDKLDMIPAEWKLVGNECSFEQIYSQVRGLLSTKHGEPGKSWGGYVEELYPSQVIYYDGLQLYSHGYKVEKDKVALTGSPTPVQRVTSYKATDGTTVTNEGSNTMATRAERVAVLITANIGWTEQERQFLEGVPEAQFIIIEKNTKPGSGGNPNPNPTPAPATPPGQTQPVVLPVPQPTGNQQGQLTLEQYIAAAPAEVREIIVNGINAHNAEKARLVAVIVGNARNKFSPAYLETLPLQQLQGIAALADVPQQTPVLNGQYNGPMFHGAATPAPTTNQQPETPLALPRMKFD